MPRSALVSLVVTALVGPLVVLTASAARAEEYTVKRGDTLGAIARRFNCPERVLKAENSLRRSVVRIGQTLVIPTEKCQPAPAPAEVEAPRGKRGSRKGGPVVVTHEVLTGETLADIAGRYLTTEAEITRLNGARATKRLRAGQKLKVQTPDPDRAQVKTTYTIQAGDTLARIAKRHDLAVADLMRMNPRKKADRLRIGDMLVVFSDVRISRSRAVGKPQNGRLEGGQQLLDGPGWFVRRPNHNWGTAEMLRSLREAFTHVRRKHPKAHDIVVGDLTKKEGGPFPPHKSHQTGIDADIGFYFLGMKPEGPKVFLDAMSHARLDLPANWTLVDFLAGPSEDRSRVDYMFIGYGVQEKLYKYAESIGVPKSRLEWIFQYPRGSRAMRGMIRHEPGHTNHIHIRFKCPRGDDECL
jgi:LysM repeat protein